MSIQKKEIKVQPEFKLADEFLDLKTLNTNVVVQHLEEQMKLREMPIEKHLKKSRLL